MSKKINVLVVEDSPVARLHLVHILSADPGIHVLGTAKNGQEAIEFVQERQPDVIVMDVHMPGLDGYETTRLIMETRPTPIVICSGSLVGEQASSNFKAMEAGALALVAKPAGSEHQDSAAQARELVVTVKLMSEVKVVRRWSRLRRSEPQTAVGEPRHPGIKVIAIGTSTGGPLALQTILAGLPKDFSVPVLIVQHIATGFLPGLVGWLSQTTGFPTHIAVHGEPLQAGHAYLAPDSYHLGIGAHGEVALSKHQPESGLRPSVAYLFRSVAAACGANAVGILLTGMGRDGAEELKHMKELGSVTIAQDAESSVVHGMPGEAIKLGAATYVLAPDSIPIVLAQLATRGR